MQQKQRYYPTTKNCATCRFWVGNRELSDTRKYVSTYPDTEGKCFGKYLKFKKLAKNTGTNCWQEFELMDEAYINRTLSQEVQDLITEIKDEKKI